jgi:tRNA nucleotidyltransferase/poly(A) polymerase
VSGSSIAGAEWLRDKDLQRLLAALAHGDDEARIAGGAVRNTLLGQAAGDIDIATTTEPDETVRRARAAGFKAVPTGAEHGTITVIAGGTPFEVTTLRHDIETDGRRARVKFGRDWQRDAERRDFTINALYAEADGTVIDLVGGLKDIETRTLRFIGDPETRIREDYLRILRFFRFFAWYGSGRPDAEGLKACARMKEGLDQLSAERVWAELKKLMSAPDPSRAVLWMRQASVLTRVLPESEKWGIDGLRPIVDAGLALGWPADPLLRLQAMLPPDSERMTGLARRLKLSGDETLRLSLWALTPPIAVDTGETQLAKLLYLGKPPGVVDRLRHALAAARDRDDNHAVAYARLLSLAEHWQAPELPIKGRDLADLGMPAGPELGALLKALEQAWVESDFSLGREALLERAAAELGKT